MSKEESRKYKEQKQTNKFCQRYLDKISQNVYSSLM